MDFLDPKKERLNRIILFVSYGLIALGITTASVILLSVTDGYCVDGKGAVDRCGLLFVSSQPSGANLYLNGKLERSRTNTKLNVRSGTYDIRVSRPGYRDWQRQATVLGGDVQRFDYPFLFPTTLKTSTVATLPAQPVFVSQSPDKRWIVLQDDGQLASLRLYDVKNSTKPAATTLEWPAGLITSGDSHTWQAVEWSDDNRHVLLKHSYVADGAASTEYLLLDRQVAAQSRNLTKDLNLASSDQLTLFNKKPAQFYVYNTDTKALRTTALSGTAPLTLQLSRVLSYKSYADDTLLYATDTPPSGKTSSGQVSIVLQQGTQSRVLRYLPAGASQYLLDIARYSGDWYVLLGANINQGVYVYRNPLDETLASSTALPSAIRFLKVAQPSYVSFSATAQYMMAENGQQFAVYDAEYDHSYSHTVPNSLDSPQTHVTWMDGNRLLYISGGKVAVVDYDNTNAQMLSEAQPSWPALFTPDYKAMLSIQSTGTGFRVSSTALTVQ